jgi:2-polyprenyl-3-methyl-5-hydroxy-6-metoxy-1,4-benzoquinol methylase
MNAEWTGERMETFIFNENSIEHLHRYSIAMEYVKGKTVLDIACGEGYGANLLAQIGKSVIGIDKDEQIIQNAKRSYVRDNLIFSEGSVEKIPLPGQHVDVVVSFETIEHTDQHERMLYEIKRVLKPGGLLIISTPDKTLYSEKRSYRNPFHKKELTRNEFHVLLKNYFLHIVLAEQRMIFGSLIKDGGSTGLALYDGDYSTIRSIKELNGIYMVALASDDQLPPLQTSFFESLGLLEKNLMDKEQAVRKTMSYRLGHLVLFPFKLLRSIFRSK